MADSSNRRGNKDRISGLDEAIRYSILSHLSTKDAATTSVLSKKWENTWRSVPHINFDSASFSHDYARMRSAVHCAITSRAPGAPIISLHLKTCQGVEISDINVLLDEALKAGIQELYLDVLPFRPIVKYNLSPWNLNLVNTPFNCNIFASQTLTSVKFKNLYLNNFPDTISMPLLNKLCMDTVLFKDWKDIRNFLVNCPSLRELETIGPIRVFVHDVLRGISEIPSEIPLCQTVPVAFMPNLVRATMSEILYLPLSLISGVQDLSIKMICSHYIPVPMLTNLTQLKISFRDYNSKTWLGKWKWIMDVLQNSPNLQHLIIHQGEMKNAIHEDIWQEPEFVPTCLSMHFRSILLRRCRGRECELQFLQYIVRNSPGILSLSLHYDASLSIYTKFNMATQLARMCSPNPDFVRYLDI